MKNPKSVSLRGLATVSALFLSGFLPSVATAQLPTLDKPAASSPPVTVRDSGDSWVLDNGIVKLTVDKNKCSVPSLVYKGQELMGPGGRWSHYPGGKVTKSITLDPKDYNGAIAEVSIKGVGSSPMDTEIRYAVQRGVSGIYTYSIYTHPASYPATGFGESRFLMQMKPDFDWLSVDKDRNMPMCTGDDIGNGAQINAKEQRILNSGIYKNSVEHKYNYSARLYSLPAFGWSSIEKQVGLWFINPSNEYMGGGPTRIDLTCHMGHTILDYWTSGHYGGGAAANVDAGMEWNKVVGPIFVYCNSLKTAQKAKPDELATFKATAGNPVVPDSWKANADALFADAIDQAKATQAKWPFNWVRGVDYPLKAERAIVSGQIVLNDPLATSKALPNLHVGLAHADYEGPENDFAKRSGNGRTVTWEHDARYYQFWTTGTEDGKFTIENIRPGTYTLYAFCNSVLSTFSKANLTVKAGQKIDIGQIQWEPLRFGQQLWDIGIPDRTGCEFYKGDEYWLWGWSTRYPLLFPNDITYTIGKSDYRKDWFFQQVPHGLTDLWLNKKAKDPANQRFGWVVDGKPDDNIWKKISKTRATTWKIKFTMPKATKGLATLRIALAGANGPLSVAVNGQLLGPIPVIGTDAIRYNTAMGVWRQYAQPFKATLLKAGENEIELNVPQGDLNAGVVYDYLRLELDEDIVPNATLNAVRIK